MKVRAVANGNVLDLPDDHPLIAAGIYEVVAEEQEAPATDAAVPEPIRRRRGRPPKPR